MTWWFVVAMGAPPDGVDVQAVDDWQARAIALRRGPEACWKLEGRARSHVAVYRPGGLFGRPSQTDYVSEGPFVGTLNAGEWSSFEATLEPVSAAAEERKDDELDWVIPVRPLVGRSAEPEFEERDGVDGEGSTAEAVSLVDRILDAVDASVTTSFATWSDETRTLELTERHPLGETGKVVELVTRFPEGNEVAAALDVTFPKRHRVPVEGAPVRITLLRPQAHVRAQMVDGEALPVSESMSLAAGALGFTVGFEQTLTYTKATACRSEAPPDTP